MDFSKPSFKYQILVYKPGRDKPDTVFHFSEGYEVSASGAITFYQFYRDPDEGGEGKPKKVAVASYPAGKWENCFLVDHFNNYLASNANSKKYSTLGSISTDSSSNNNHSDTSNSAYSSNNNDSYSNDSSTEQNHYQNENNTDEYSSNSSYQDTPSPSYENQTHEENKEPSYDDILNLDAPSYSNSSEENTHQNEENKEPSYDYNNYSSTPSESSSSSNSSGDDYSSLESFLVDEPSSHTTTQTSEPVHHMNTDTSMFDEIKSVDTNQEVSIDSIYNTPKEVVTSTPLYTQPLSSANNPNAFNSTNNMNSASSNSQAGGFNKPAYNNNGKFNKGGNNQQMSFAEMKALKENFLANSIINYMSMKDKIFNLDQIVDYATRYNANSIRFNPDDVVLVAYNLIKDKKVSPEKYTNREKQKRLNLYLPPIIKRHGLEKKSMLVTYLNDKEETKDMNLLDLGAWLVYNGYV